MYIDLRGMHEEGSGEVGSEPQTPFDKTLWQKVLCVETVEQVQAWKAGIYNEQDDSKKNQGTNDERVIELSSLLIDYYNTNKQMNKLDNENHGSRTC